MGGSAAHQGTGPDSPPVPAVFPWQAGTSSPGSGAVAGAGPALAAVLARAGHERSGHCPRCCQCLTDTPYEPEPKECWGSTVTEQGLTAGTP